MKQCFFVDRTRLIGILKERFDFRGECDPTVMNAVVERLNADPVTNQPEAMCVCVPEGYGKHAAKFLQTIDAPLRKGVQDNLGVGVIRFPAALSVLFKLSPYLRMVIDLTVEDDLQRPVLIAHGLSSGIREIDDGKPPVCQAHAAVGRNPQPGAIRPAMDHGLPHADKVFRSHLEVAVLECQYAGDSTHARHRAYTLTAGSVMEEMTEQAIHEFWDTHPCGESQVDGLSVDHEAFFRRYDTFRYQWEAHILSRLDAIDFQGRRVLEIGLGQGADSEQIIRRGAIWSGLDLSPESISRVSTRLRLRGIPYQRLECGNALSMPFHDNSFDIVFSHGVLHHIPDL